MDIESIIKNTMGKQVISMPSKTDEWLSWYIGNVKDFHHYKAYNGKRKVNCTRKTLNIAKKASEDYANLLLNERADVAYGDDEGQQQLWDMLNFVKFWQIGNEGIEKSFALGNGALVEGVDANGNEKLQFVNAKKIYPLTIEDGKITESAFVNVNSDNLVIQYHFKDDDGLYYIRTQVYKVISGQNIGELEEDELFETKSKTAWFQFIRPNIANNIDINSPLGISVFANALDIAMGIDLAYDGFCEEMRLGKLRTFVNSRLVRYEDGCETPIFDADDVGFYIMSDNADDTKEPLKFYAPALRTDSYMAGVNNGLNLFSSAVGFGQNHYKFDSTGLSTATQVVSENSDMFRTIKKHEILLNDVIIDCCRALMYIHNEFTNKPYKFDLEGNIEVKFDDSIIEDKETEKANDRTDVGLGVMSKVQYRMKWFNEDEETARANIEAIKQEKQGEMTDIFSTEE